MQTRHSSCLVLHPRDLKLTAGHPLAIFADQGHATPQGYLPNDWKGRWRGGVSRKTFMGFGLGLDGLVGG